MKHLCAKLEQASLQTEWSVWMKRVLTAVERVDFPHPETWGPLASFSKNIPAMRWLAGQLRRLDPVPPEQPRVESAFYMLAAFCPDNSVLGYVIDTWRYYYRTRNSRGLLSCARIHSLVNRHDEYPHLNALYNLMMGDVIREYRLYAAAADSPTGTAFLTGRDFRTLGKYLPDFHPFGFRERVWTARAGLTGAVTGEELAGACCMSASAFRRHFKREFGMPVSEWLRRQRMERIGRMLRDPEIPLEQVAESCGFNLASTFSDYCRRNFGLSPGQMRKKNRGQ